MMSVQRRGYDRLDADALHATIGSVRAQIDARFQASGLADVAATLEDVCVRVKAGAADVRRPYVILRGIIIAAMGASIWAVARWFGIGAPVDLGAAMNGGSTFDLIQALEALFNGVFLLLAGVVFIASVEERWKRSKALRILHRVRSITHVIDMHQLTKDPTSLGQDPRFSSGADLVRYLEFCTDLLSLTGKLGALYAQDMADPVVIDTVNDIETLSTNLARKIWQKILIIRSTGAEAG